MKRTPTPPWVFVAAAGLVLAALTLTVWAMEQGVEAEEASAEPPPAPAEAPAPAVAAHVPAAAPQPAVAPAPQVPPARPPAAAAPAPPVPAPVPEPAAEPSPGPAIVHAGRFNAERFGNGASGLENHVAPPRFDVPLDDVPRPKPAPAVVRVQAPSPEAPMFGAPPARAREPLAEELALPRFVTDAADATTQIVRGSAGDGVFAFGFYADGNIRFADVDGGRYTGVAESARARMREVDGTRAFTVQIGVAADGRLQATFTGGPHDAQTIPLDPQVGWSAA